MYTRFKNDLEVIRVKEQYQELMDQVFCFGQGKGIGIKLYRILPKWEREIFTGTAVPLYDKSELRDNDNEAASFLISLPGALRRGAILCESNGASEEASHLMKISEEFAEVLEKARAILCYYRNIGEDLWDRFRGGKEAYYGIIVH